MTLLAVAALSARQLAQAAAQDGFDVVALDLFGDADTRQAAVCWRAVGDAATLRIDPLRLLSALHELASRGDVLGWVAGAGFEGLPDLLEAAARVLPLLGTAAVDVRRLRDPVTFFAFLDRHALPHPVVSFEPPSPLAGWLSKDAGGSGGWHIRMASEHLRPVTGTLTQADGGGQRSEQRYFQRLSGGLPMSATFLASAEGCRVLGVNRLLVRQIGHRPFVFHGAIGPLAVAPALLAQLEQALQLIGNAFRMRGLGSLDFLLDGDRAWLLEVNPRPPASMALYGGVVDGGLMAAQVQAAGGATPWAEAASRSPPVRMAPIGGHELHGFETVFAPGHLQIDAVAAQLIAQWPGSHDWPSVGARCAAGEPLCSVSASGADTDAVAQALAASRAGLLRQIAGAFDGIARSGTLGDGQHHRDHARRETSQ